MSLARLGQPMCLAAGEPSDPGRVKVLARANERMRAGVGGNAAGGVVGVREELMVSLNAWEPVTLCQR